MLNQIISKHRFHSILIAILLFGLCGLGPIAAQTPRQSASRGVGHYSGGEYDQALAEFMIGLQAAPDRNELKYDVGAAHYQLQNYPEAA
ncbi:MAG: hypothetical protein P9M15_07485, partial [Candidatus Electryoneaceae bacterium]|nr:hypothetical protein [Candidatus Electryoneaceae bacterium]